MGLLVEPVTGSRRFGLILVAGAAWLSLGLLVLVPALVEYRGASGLAMLLVGIAGMQAWRQRPGLRLMTAGALLALLAKVAWEACGSGGALADLPAGVAVAWQAHALGLLAGAVAGAALRRSAPSVASPVSRAPSRRRVHN